MWSSTSSNPLHRGSLEAYEIVHDSSPSPLRFGGFPLFRSADHRGLAFAVWGIVQMGDQMDVQQNCIQGFFLSPSVPWMKRTSHLPLYLQIGESESITGMVPKALVLCTILYSRPEFQSPLSFRPFLFFVTSTFSSHDASCALLSISNFAFFSSAHSPAL